MDSGLFLKAAMLGFAVAVPVGPMGLLFMQRSLAGGFGAGLAVGAGVALGDATYAALAGFALAGVNAVLGAIGPWVRVGGGVVLVWLGLRIAKRGFRARVEPGPPPRAGANLLAAYGLTLANPPTVIFFAATFAAMAPLPGTASALVFTAGVLSGSLAWWMLFGAILAGLRHRLGPGTLRSIDFVSGLALAAFGGWTVLQAIPPQ